MFQFYMSRYRMFKSILYLPVVCYGFLYLLITTMFYNHLTVYKFITDNITLIESIKLSSATKTS